MHRRLWIALGMLAVGGCRWSEVPKDAVYACANGVCPSGFDCRAGYCFADPTADAGSPPDAGEPDAGLSDAGFDAGFDGGFDAGCVPTTCSAAGHGCGDVNDGCGQTLHCGTCSFPFTCGGGPTPFSCGCTPPQTTAQTECRDAGVSCGLISRFDGCGAVRTFDCGSDGGVQCACTPLPSSVFCADAGYNCGTFQLSDNCGRPQAMSCGTCTAGKSCLMGDFGGVCQPCAPETDSEFCDRQGANCGPRTAPDNCGVVRTASCGPCEGDGGCGINLCQCQPNLGGCLSAGQCCSGTCGSAGKCCEAQLQPCNDDSDCCIGSCSQGFCEQLTSN